MQRRIDTDARSAKYAFDSLAELGRYIDTERPTWRNERSSLDNPPSQSWDLGAGYKACVEYAQNGWIEGAQRAQEALKVFAPATPKPDVRNDFYGHTPNVPRFCAGAPDSMVRHVYNAKQGMGRVLTLIVPVTANANTNAANMANFGLAVAQYINQLETSGVRVELFGAICSTPKGWRVSYTWLIKAADQYLDLAVIAFSIGHPGMLRRLGLALLERCPSPEAPSYGGAQDIVLADVINAPPGAIILNGMLNANSTSATPEAALTYISAQIDKAMENPEASA